VTAIDVRRLPRRTLRAGTVLYRIHRAHLEPWFFDSSPHGRFNPTGTPGRGTCYWAQQPLAAWVESFRTVMTLTPGDVATRALSTIALDADLAVRDLTVKRALAAGVTVAITGGGDYTRPQSLADALQGISDGLRYRVGHDPSGKLMAIAWFGDAGAAAGAGLPAATTTEIPDALIDEARRLFRYLVVPPPL